MKKIVIGRIILIEHSGKPMIWPVHRGEVKDDTQLDSYFDRMKTMCAYELALGGCLKLFDMQGNLLKEQRGV
tara:strand:- start:290 stop:505 length:216 start_codon:yes stop_codon:yes gene_type:complete